MPSLVFNLKNVPDDEANDVRELLNENNIDFYETSAGNWGASLPAIWVENSDQLKPARELIDAYQQKRSQQAQDDYQQQKLSGRNRTLLDAFLEEPLRILIYFVGIALVLYISARIVLDLSL